MMNQSENSMEWPTAMIVNPAPRTSATSSSAVCLHVEFVLRRTILRLALISLPLMTAACGTYNLGNVRPQANKTADQQQLDMLTCKDQASLAVNSAGHQTADFFLGLTVVGAPVAYANDKVAVRRPFFGEPSTQAPRRSAQLTSHNIDRWYRRRDRYFSTGSISPFAINSLTVLFANSGTVALRSHSIARLRSRVIE
jgi:hypothetical protein